MQNILNLSEYINSGRILVNIENNNLFDVVIFESRKFLEKDFLDSEWPFKVLFLEDFAFDWGLAGVLDGFENKKVLLVLTEYNSFYLLPLLNIKATKFKKLHILNTNVGISSFVFKNLPEIKDITWQSEYGLVLEPFDFEDMISNLSKEGVVYQRISNKDYAVDVFNGQVRGQVDNVSIVDLTGANLSGQNGTILVAGYMLPQLLQAMDVLHSYDMYFDVFVLRDYKMELIDSLKESVRNTERLIFVGDIGSNFVEYLIKTRLFDANIFDVAIDLILPHYEKIDTTLTDYLFERAEFDYKSLAERIKNLI
jgi:hypothetical protein